MTEKIRVSVDPDSMTMGDLEDFESYTGTSFAESVKHVKVLDDEGNVKRDDRGRPETQVQMTAKAMTALMWIAIRQDRPGFTVKEAREVRPSAIEWVGGDDDDEAAGDGAGK